MTITAKHAGRCRACGGGVDAGERVEWERGKGVAHVTCPATPKPVQERDATAPQLRWLRTLVGERELEETTRAAIVARLDAEDVTFDRASSWIERLMALPKSKDAAPQWPGQDVLPAGRYAVDESDGSLGLYHVWRGSRNPDFVRVYEVRSGDEAPRAEWKRVIDAVMVDPYEAALRYGRETECCSICAKGLENNLSRRLAIGPVCGKRFHANEQWTRIKAEARAWLRERGIDPAGTMDAISDRRAEKAAFAVREAAQERAAFEAKMKRDREAA